MVQHLHDQINQIREIEKSTGKTMIINMNSREIQTLREDIETQEAKTKICIQEIDIILAKLNR
jgi:hypothetical protein